MNEDRTKEWMEAGPMGLVVATIHQDLVQAVRALDRTRTEVRSMIQREREDRGPEDRARTRPEDPVLQKVIKDVQSLPNQLRVVICEGDRVVTRVHGGRDRAAGAGG